MLPVSVAQLEPLMCFLAATLCALGAGVDLISFSGILYSIYPPLFLALLVYSIGGTGTSLFLGRKLVGLNFQQEAQEANFRYASGLSSSPSSQQDWAIPSPGSLSC